MKSKRIFLESDMKKRVYIALLFGSTTLLFIIIFMDIFKGINAELSLKIFIYSIFFTAFFITLYLVLKYFSKFCSVFDHKFIICNMQKKFEFKFADINEVVLMPQCNSLGNKDNTEWFYLISKTKEAFLKHENIRKIIVNSDFFILSVDKANKLKNFFKQYSKDIVCPEKYKHLLKDGFEYFTDINNLKE